MENNLQKYAEYESETDLRELMSVLRAGSRKIITITAVFTFISIIYAFSVPNQYKATALLAPAQSESSDLSGALGQLDGLASLAGVNIGASENTEAQIAQEIMKSWSFIDSFISKNFISVEVYAAKGWNRESNELLIDDDLYDVETNTWFVKDDNTGEVGIPSSWQLFESFSERLLVLENNKSNLISVSIEHYSPYLAKQWLDMFIAAINTHMQQRQMTKVTENINYLQAQIDTTSIAEMREVFYNIIEEQMKNKMLAEASPEYAFVVVSPNMVPEEKSKPQRVLIIILGTLLGMMLSIIIVLVIYYFRKSD